MEQVLHLFITNKCRHNCPLCCNKLYKIDEIPVVTVELLKSVETVCLTGGEPFSINPTILADFINKLRRSYRNIKNLYIYGSGREVQMNLIEVKRLLTDDMLINGINLAPKDFEDWMRVSLLLRGLPSFFSVERSCRLYVFKGMENVANMVMSDINNVHIDVINRQWIKEFKTPDNEHFARLPILF